MAARLLGSIGNSVAASRNTWSLDGPDGMDGHAGGPKRKMVVYLDL